MERPAVLPGSRSPTAPAYNNATSTLAFDQHFTSTAKGRLLLAEIVFGMLVWILVGGTDYFQLSALCWVMFSSILLWILTVCLFIVYLAGVHHRIPRVPWTTLSLCMNCSATALYLVAAVVTALCVTPATRGRHNYNCWAASAAASAGIGARVLMCSTLFVLFFSSLTTVCYAGSSYLSYQVWKTQEEEQ